MSTTSGMHGSLRFLPSREIADALELLREYYPEVLVPDALAPTPGKPTKENLEVFNTLPLYMWAEATDGTFVDWDVSSAAWDHLRWAFWSAASWINAGADPVSDRRRELLDVTGINFNVDDHNAEIYDRMVALIEDSLMDLQDLAPEWNLQVEADIVVFNGADATRIVMKDGVISLISDDTERKAVWSQS